MASSVVLVRAGANVLAVNVGVTVLGTRLGTWLMVPVGMALSDARHDMRAHTQP